MDSFLSAFGPRPVIRPLHIALFTLVSLWVAGAPVHGQPPPEDTSQKNRIDSTTQQARPDSSQYGVVWRPPESPERALRELASINEAGVRALRLLNVPSTDTVFARADALGLHLLIDLPVAYVPTSSLADSLSEVRPLLSRLRDLSQRYESIRYVGLATNVNSTRAATCDVLQQWTQTIHETSPLRTYYVTPFSSSTDRCAESVDLPLLDTRGVEHPVDRWQSWTDATSRGIGALGTWINPKSPPGLQNSHSPEQHARHLERALRSLLDPPPSTPPVFVYRWQDRPTPLLDTRRYGLHPSTGPPRPAGNVMRGFYTGTQRVFAFPKGTPPTAAPHVFVLLGWGLLGLLGVLYARRPFARETAYRYFAAHGFYRDALQKERDVNSTVNILLLTVAALAVGMIASLSAQIIRAQPSTVFILEALPSDLQKPLANGLTAPAMAGLVVGTISFLLLSVWMGFLILAARTKSSFSALQGLMLVVWPCWPALVGMLLALIAATAPPVAADDLGLLLLAGGVGTLATVTSRVLLDYKAVSGLSWARVLPLVLPSPLVLVLGGMVALILSYDLPLSLLWQLAAHS